MFRQESAQDLLGSWACWLQPSVNEGECAGRTLIHSCALKDTARVPHHLCASLYQPDSRVCQVATPGDVYATANHGCSEFATNDDTRHCDDPQAVVECPALIVTNTPTTSNGYTLRADEFCAAGYSGTCEFATDAQHAWVSDGPGLSSRATLGEYMLCGGTVGACTLQGACKVAAIARSLSASLFFSVTLEAEIESFNLTTATAAISSATLVPLYNLDVTVSGGSVLLGVEMWGANLTLLRQQMQRGLDTATLSQALGASVSHISAPTEPAVCASDGSDEKCDEWSTAAWADDDSEYGFYLYDEVEDENLLKFWEYPRTSPTADLFKNNGFCEDGSESLRGRLPGEYFIRFSAHCATDSVTVLTGTYDNCGRVAYVPCVADCADCGRAASSQRRRRASLALPTSVRGFHEFLVNVHEGLANGTIAEARLPESHNFWLTRIHNRRLEPFASRQEFQHALERFVRR